MKQIILFIFLVCTCKHAYAQQYPLIGQYMFNKLFYNPAFAGTNESMNATVFYRHQWAGFSGAPKTFLFNIDAPIQNQKAGIGLNLMNDSRGVTNQTDMYLNYAYRIPVANETTLSMGIKGGASYFRSGLTNLNPEKDEQIFDENITSALLPKVGFGLYLYNPTFYAGISTPDLVTYDPNKIFASSNGKTFSNRKNYLLTAGYNLYVNELITLT
ncbi:MAG TPA: PorP/SprF family type IX secretion system membrane protein, partial [Cytophagaceae bacterium]